MTDELNNCNSTLFLNFGMSKVLSDLQTATMKVICNNESVNNQSFAVKVSNVSIALLHSDNDSASGSGWHPCSRGELRGRGGGVGSAWGGGFAVHDVQSPAPLALASITVVHRGPVADNQAGRSSSAQCVTRRKLFAEGDVEQCVNKGS